MIILSSFTPTLMRSAKWSSLMWPAPIASWLFSSSESFAAPRTTNRSEDLLSVKILRTRLFKISLRHPLKQDPPLLRLKWSISLRYQHLWSFAMCWSYLYLDLGGLHEKSKPYHFPRALRYFLNTIHQVIIFFILSKEKTRLINKSNFRKVQVFLFNLDRYFVFKLSTTPRPSVGRPSALPSSLLKETQ